MSKKALCDIILRVVILHLVLVWQKETPLCNKKEISKQRAREAARWLSSFRLALMWGGVKD